jgi:hypothetical protein
VFDVVDLQACKQTTQTKRKLRPMPSLGVNLDHIAKVIT